MTAELRSTVEQREKEMLELLMELNPDNGRLTVRKIETRIIIIRHLEEKKSNVPLARTDSLFGLVM